MPHYKDLDGKFHFLDDAAYEHLLPAGCVQVTDEEVASIGASSVNHAEVRKAQIAARLSEIDLLSVRPLRSMQSGSASEFDVKKLNALDQEAVSLRAELAAIPK